MKLKTIKQLSQLPVIWQNIETVFSIFKAACTTVCMWTYILILWNWYYYSANNCVHIKWFLCFRFWWRLWTTSRWHGGAPLSRRQVREKLCLTQGKKYPSDAHKWNDTNVYYTVIDYIHLLNCRVLCLLCKTHKNYNYTKSYKIHQHVTRANRT